MPSYVIVDPLGEYAAHMKGFLDRLELPAIAVFTSKMRYGGWEYKWRHRLGEHVVGIYVADGDDDLAGLAAQIKAEHSDGFYGVVMWDEMHMLFGAELGEKLGLDWNPRHVVERCRDKFVMKQWLRQVETVRINASRVVENAEDALTFQQELGTWPVVVGWNVPQIRSRIVAPAG